MTTKVRIAVSATLPNAACFALLVISIATSTVKAQTFAYLGCWSDPDASKRDVSGSSQSLGSKMTLSTCTSYCSSNDYAYAGLQFGSQCHCGSTYGSHGSSSDCNFTCASRECGGYQANSVYYALDHDLASTRQLVLRTSPLTFTKARMECVYGNGDLETPTGNSSIQAIIGQIPVNSTWSTSITSVWVGLWRRASGADYEWTNPNQQPAYSGSAYSAIWTNGDAQTLDCVSLNIATQRLESADCAKQKPYICRALANPDTGTETPTTAAPSTGLSDDAKKLALFIVLPLFLCCYGGSCIIYCLHKIIHNCAKAQRIRVPESDDAKPPASLPPMVMPQAAAGLGARAKLPMMMKPMAGDGGFPTKMRPLSGRHNASVSPAPSASFMEATEPRRPVTPIMHEMKAKADDPTDIGLKPLSAQPPPYVDREEARRARLLENAAREARERKQAREGSAASRPTTGASRPSPEPTDSDRAKLIDDSPLPTPRGPSASNDSPMPRSQGAATPQGLAGMSINDILKMKMAQKADGKKKPRKIITT